MTTGTETRTGTRSGIANASPIGFALFGFALFVFGIRFVSVDSAAAGLNYAILAAAIAETISGLLEIIRGSAYPGYVLTTFGIWLTGLYFLLTVGPDSKIFTPDAVAWYALGLIVPVAYMALPALLHRNGPLVAAFVAILGTLLCLGISETNGSSALATASGWFGFAAAAAIWYMGARDVLRQSSEHAKAVS